MPSAHAALQRFLAAFSQLQLDEMLSYFAEDATAFFPVEHHRERLVGKEAIRAAFSKVLARVQASGATRMQLDAEDVQTQDFGVVAIVTFHLHGDHLSRRTFVLRQSGEQWLIVHFHGSNAPT